MKIMKTFILCTLTMVMPVVISPMAFGESPVDRFGDPLGTYRLLVLCATDEDVPLQRQIYGKIDWIEFEDRDLLVVKANPKSVETVHGEYVLKTMAFGTKLDFKRTPHSDLKVKDKAQCGEDFEIVLIGKDTGVKKRWDMFPPQEEIFNTIDAMPMRRYEMKTRAGQK